MKIVFQISGGIGKSVAATAVCKAIKTRYPDPSASGLPPFRGPDVIREQPPKNPAYWSIPLGPIIWQRRASAQNLSTFLTPKPHNQLSLKPLPTAAFVDIFIC